MPLGRRVECIIGVCTASIAVTAPIRGLNVQDVEMILRSKTGGQEGIACEGEGESRAWSRSEAGLRPRTGGSFWLSTEARVWRLEFGGSSSKPQPCRRVRRRRGRSGCGLRGRGLQVAASEVEIGSIDEVGLLLAGQGTGTSPRLVLLTIELSHGRVSGEGSDQGGRIM